MSSHGWEHDMLSVLSPDKTKTQEAPTAQTLTPMYYIFLMSGLVVKDTHSDISLSEIQESSYFTL